MVSISDIPLTHTPFETDIPQDSFPPGYIFQIRTGKIFCQRSSGSGWVSRLQIYTEITTALQSSHQKVKKNYQLIYIIL